MKTLADRINELMKDMDMTQEQLADAIGISQASVNKITIGKTKKPREIVAIAKVLRTTPEYLLDGKQLIPGELSAAQIALGISKEAFEFAKLFESLCPEQKAALSITAEAFVHSANKSAKKVA